MFRRFFTNMVKFLSEYRQTEFPDDSQQIDFICFSYDKGKKPLSDTSTIEHTANGFSLTVILLPIAINIIKNLIGSIFTLFLI